MTNETRRKDYWTGALTVLFLVSLAVVFLVDEPELWLGWSIVAVAVSGAVMVLFNRESPQEP